MTTLDIETNFLEQRAWFLPRNSPSTLSCCICFNIRVTNVPDCMGTMLGLKCRKVQFVLTFFVFRPTFLRNFRLTSCIKVLQMLDELSINQLCALLTTKLQSCSPSCSFVGQVELLQKTLSRFSVRNLQILLF